MLEGVAVMTQSYYNTTNKLALHPGLKTTYHQVTKGTQGFVSDLDLHFSY